VRERRSDSDTRKAPVEAASGVTQAQRQRRCYEIIDPVRKGQGPVQMRVLGPRERPRLRARFDAPSRPPPNSHDRFPK